MSAGEHYARCTGALHWDLQYVEMCLRLALQHHETTHGLRKSIEETLATVRRGLAAQDERDAANGWKAMQPAEPMKVSA